MASNVEIERKLLLLDKELHAILNLLKGKGDMNAIKVVETSCGAWDYDVDSKTFVDQLRKSTRLDWIK
ncbi:MAG: hypothetical protein K0A89_10330 [ANME-2 cluster archaeon]|nr:hypothetical protein [ANME-2 cluster archaeon]MCL7475996.1 hypothetical protein [ANME-2 cluster archaeon]MDF1531750.1 hypothetical protein [ANME-2 cluster archaeon]MDW7776649.1 hypothetical protein [Methanosarcinales archaeon]